MSQAIIDLIRRKATAFASAQGASAQEAEAFARSAITIAYGESGFNPAAVGDRGMSYGLFQNHLQGRGAGHSPDRLRDPNYNIDLSLPELWSGFRAAGGGASFSQNPAATVQRMWGIAQRPSPAALAKAGGTIVQGLQIAGGGALPAGSRSMAQTGGAPVTKTTGPTFSQQQLAQIEGELNRINTRINELIAYRSDPNWQPVHEKELATLMSDRTILLQDAVNLQKVVAEERKAGGGEDFGENIGFYNTLWEMSQSVFGNDATSARMFYDILVGNRTDALNALNSEYEKGRLTLDAAIKKAELHAQQQTLQLAYMADALKRAQFIDEGRRKNVMMKLPPGTKYHPMWAPNSMMNAVAARLGLPPMVLEVVQQDFDELDPMRILGEGQQSLANAGVKLPQVDLTEVTAAQQQIQRLPTYSGAPIDPTGIVPSGPDPSMFMAGMFEEWNRRRPLAAQPVEEEPPPGFVPLGGTVQSGTPAPGVLAFTSS